MKRNCPCTGKKCKLPAGDPRHGTLNGYTNCSCRCDPCRGANAEYTAAARQRRAEQEPPEHIHGTPGGYNNWHCRCARCTRAWADYWLGNYHRTKGEKVR